MALSEMMRFLKYDHPALYRLLIKFNFTRGEDYLVLGPKNVATIKGAEL